MTKLSFVPACSAALKTDLHDLVFARLSHSGSLQVSIKNRSRSCFTEEAGNPHKEVECFGIT